MAMSRCQTALQLLVLVFGVLLTGESQAASISDPSCPRGSSFGCKPSCYSSCNTLNVTACSAACTPACVCDKGYVFQSANSDVCVPAESCDVTCPENAYFNPCYRQPLETCANLGIHFEPSETICLARCVCKDGYVLSSEPIPRCINKKKC